MLDIMDKLALLTLFTSTVVFASPMYNGYDYNNGYASHGSSYNEYGQGADQAQQQSHGGYDGRETAKTWFGTDPFGNPLPGTQEEYPEFSTYQPAVEAPQEHRQDWSNGVADYVFNPNQYAYGGAANYGESYQGYDDDLSGMPSLERDDESTPHGERSRQKKEISRAEKALRKFTRGSSSGKSNSSKMRGHDSRLSQSQSRSSAEYQESDFE